MKPKHCHHEYTEKLAKRLAARCFRRCDLSEVRIQTWSGSTWRDSHVASRALRIEIAIQQAVRSSPAHLARVTAMKAFNALPDSQRRAIEWAGAERCRVSSKAEILMALKARRLNTQTIIEFSNTGHWYLPAVSTVAALEESCTRIARQLGGTAEAALFGRYARKPLKAPEPAVRGWRGLLREFHETGERCNALNVALSQDSPVFFNVVREGAQGAVFLVLKELSDGFAIVENLTNTSAGGAFRRRSYLAHLQSAAIDTAYGDSVETIGTAFELKRDELLAATSTMPKQDQAALALAYVRVSEPTAMSDDIPAEILVAMPKRESAATPVAALTRMTRVMPPTSMIKTLNTRRRIVGSAGRRVSTGEGLRQLRAIPS